MFIFMTFFTPILKLMIKKIIKMFTSSNLNDLDANRWIQRILLSQKFKYKY
jgi:hypothetical protein